MFPRSHVPHGNAFLEALTPCLIGGRASNQPFPCSAWERENRTHVNYELLIICLTTVTKRSMSAEVIAPIVETRKID